MLCAVEIGIVKNKVLPVHVRTGIIYTLLTGSECAGWVVVLG